MAATKEYGETERLKKWVASVEANLESAMPGSYMEHWGSGQAGVELNAVTEVGTEVKSPLKTASAET